MLSRLSIELHSSVLVFACVCLVFSNCEDSAVDRKSCDLIEVANDGHTVLFKNNEETLVESKSEIYFVLGLSDDCQWAYMSKMSSDPNIAKGTSEVYELWYLPKRKSAPLDSIEPLKGWSFARLNDDNAVFVSKDINNNKEKTVPLSFLLNYM